MLQDYIQHIWKITPPKTSFRKELAWVRDRASILMGSDYKLQPSWAPGRISLQ